MRHAERSLKDAVIAAISNSFGADDEV